MDDLIEKAWLNYCEETTSNMDVRDSWDELPEYVQRLYLAEAKNAELLAVIDRLRGQLQNSVSHLDRVKRRYNDKAYDVAIEFANKALYETLVQHNSEVK